MAPSCRASREVSTLVGYSFHGPFSSESAARVAALALVKRLERHSPPTLLGEDLVFADG